MLTYLVNKLPKTSLAEHLLDFDWSLAEEGLINNHLWASNDYKPDTRFYLQYDKSNLYGIILTKGDEEMNPRATVTEFQGPVHLDSCLEFFFSFEPDNNAYANLETNNNAVVHLGVGAGRANRVKPSEKELEDLELYTIDSNKVSVKGIRFAFDWGVGFKIPAKLLFELWHKYGNASETLDDRFFSGQEIMANFYKCGDDTAFEHYLSWNEVELEQPDFHRPEYFGKLILE